METIDKHKVKNKIKESNTLIKNKEYNQAISLLVELLEEFPTAGLYAKLGEAYLSNSQLQKAYELLKEGLDRYPKNHKITKQLASLYMEKKEWKKASSYWRITLKRNKEEENSDNIYINLGKSLRLSEQFEDAEKILSEGINLYPNNRKLRFEIAQLYMDLKDWKLALNYWEDLIETHGSHASLSAKVNHTITMQITGKKLNNDFLEENSLDIKIKYKNGYKKIILFDNGESRIEFYKNLYKQSDTVCVTFDPWKHLWNKEPFAYQFLIKQGIDIIAVRKRREDTFHQDLTIEEFQTTISSLCQTYRHQVVYGSSLGAYCALYYGPVLNCQILAFSPRNPGHPVFGIPLKYKVDFKHDLTINAHSHLSPIISYDPKDTVDNNYVEKELINAFPNATFLKCEYAGHTTIKYFLEIGELKSIVLSVLNGEELKVINRKNRSKSSEYLGTLGKECLKRNKYNWALSLSNRALELETKNKDAIILKIDALKELDKTEQAASFTEEAIKVLPKNKKIRLSLIDLYITLDNKEKAMQEIEKAIEDFPDSTVFLLRKNTIQES
ncbi:tetratricopeptide repeat protein [Metabacillus halosaccharovorans]|uniref:tetratricopeptide repeat protein n=1 Tax=Metabacillus halosaccharovorans TaxID=930124 RepID=UPI0034CE47CF